eukprot:scaffold99811_cov46-Phaeocystis_antarctica.AAC.3
MCARPTSPQRAYALFMRGRLWQTHRARLAAVRTACMSTGAHMRPSTRVTPTVPGVAPARSRRGALTLPLT